QRAFRAFECLGCSALARLVALVDGVDDVEAPAAANQLVGPVAAQQGLERVGDFHRSASKTKTGAARPLRIGADISAKARPVNAGRSQSAPVSASLAAPGRLASSTTSSSSRQRWQATSRPPPAS